MSSIRRSSIGSLYLLIATSVFFIVICVGFLYFVWLMSGGHEAQNATDACALDTAKEALIRPGIKIDDPSVDPQFTGLANRASNGGGNSPDAFSLVNINRVWGQSALVTLNEKAMEAEGSANREAAKHAEAVVKAALKLNNQLAKTMSNDIHTPPPKGILSTAFETMAKANSARMLSSNKAISNIKFSSGSLAFARDGIAGPSNMHTELDRTLTSQQPLVITANLKGWQNDPVVSEFLRQRTDINNGSYLNGYTPLNMGYAGKIYFVPLKPSSKPHMVSAVEFAASQFNPVSEVTSDAVANTFKAQGSAQDSKTKSKFEFEGISVAQPLDNTFPLAIPHGFIKIVNFPGLPFQKWGVPGRSQVGSVQGDTGRSNLAAFGDRGLHAAEYVSHQLLLARSNYNPKMAPDFFTNSMDGPTAAIASLDYAGSGAAIGRDGVTALVGQEQDIREIVDMNQAANEFLLQNKGADPELARFFPDDLAPNGMWRNAQSGGGTCGGRLMLPMKLDSHCRDILGLQRTDASTLAFDGHGDLFFGFPPQAVKHGDLNTAAFQALLSIRQQGASDQILPAVDLETRRAVNVFGSDILPIIFSTYPPAGTFDGIISSSNYTRRADQNSTGPNDFNLMYSGMLIMPTASYGPAITAGTDRLSRGPVLNNPGLFGQAGTLWDYLYDPACDTLRARLLQRILEICPSFGALKGDRTPDYPNGVGSTDFSQSSDSPLHELLSQTTIDMNEDAYIFLDDTQNPPHMVVVKTPHGDLHALSKWPWLQEAAKTADSSLDGHAIPADSHHPNGTIVYGTPSQISTDPSGDQYLVNVWGDWGYDKPYANANIPGGAQLQQIFLQNKYVFKPSSGFNNLLAVLELRSFINHDSGSDCPATVDATNTSAFRVQPEDCPCAVFPPRTAPEGQSDPFNPFIPNRANTPPGWTRGSQIKTDKLIPNCSLIGAC